MMSNPFLIAGMLSFNLIAPLIAQTGTTKTLIGWVIVLLCIGLGLLVVCRPSGRMEKKPRASGKG
jgi:hypothetical protein